MAAPAVHYGEATRQPLYCLAFLFPLVGAYEFGAMLLRPRTFPERLLLAPSFIQEALAWFGAVGPLVPGLALLATLTAWHMMSRHNWQLRVWMVLLMFAERSALSVPLVV
ncbi:MAG: hypothetical protein HZB38_10340, partial [Planctomycetes bacterium]|nr:hypothetical protein [Planctomycetota bacterium]